VAEQIDEPTIEFDFEVVKIQSMADGSPRLVLGLSEADVKVAAMLWECKLDGMVLHASVTVEE